MDLIYRALLPHSTYWNEQSAARYVNPIILRNVNEPETLATFIYLSSFVSSRLQELGSTVCVYELYELILELNRCLACYIFINVSNICSNGSSQKQNSEITKIYFFVFIRIFSMLFKLNYILVKQLFPFFDLRLEKHVTLYHSGNIYRTSHKTYK